jgi:hypothetical protein
MEQFPVEAATVDATPNKAVWNAPLIVETDIETITAAGSGSAGDGVTTSS